MSNITISNLQRVTLPFRLQIKVFKVWMNNVQNVHSAKYLMPLSLQQRSKGITRIYQEKWNLHDEHLILVKEADVTLCCSDYLLQSRSK